MKVSYLVDSQYNTSDTTRLDKMSSEPESFPFTQSKWAKHIISELRELFATSVYCQCGSEVTFKDVIAPLEDISVAPTAGVIDDSIVKGRNAAKEIKNHLLDSQQKSTVNVNSASSAAPQHPPAAGAAAAALSAAPPAEAALSAAPPAAYVLEDTSQS